MLIHDPQIGNTNQSSRFMNNGFNNNNQNNYNNMQYQNHNSNTGGVFASWANGSTYTPIAHNGIHNNTMCMLQSIDDINIETAEPEPESKTQIPESENTETGPRNQIQSPESENNTDIQIDFYHTEDKPYYRAYYETKEYTDILETIPVNDEEDPVMEEHIMASETIHDSATKIHIQKLFGMNDNSYCH